MSEKRGELRERRPIAADFAAGAESSADRNGLFAAQDEAIRRRRRTGAAFFARRAFWYKPRSEQGLPRPGSKRRAASPAAGTGSGHGRLTPIRREQRDAIAAPAAVAGLRTSPRPDRRRRPLRLVLQPGGAVMELTRPDVVVGRHSRPTCACRCPT